jgi:hypothetical protein
MLVREISIEEHSAVSEQCFSSLKVVSKYFSTWAQSGPFCLISSDPVLHKGLTDYMVWHGMDGTPCSPEVFSKAYARFVDLKPGLVVLCVDDFDGIGEVYNKLRYFRDERPNVPILLTSVNFKLNDLSVERLPICDTSIKMPLDTALLDECFMAVWSNNECWANRQGVLGNF